MRKYSIEYVGNYTVDSYVKGKKYPGRITVMYSIDCFLEHLRDELYTLHIPSQLPFATKRVIAQALGKDITRAKLWASEEEHMCTVTCSINVIQELINKEVDLENQTLSVEDLPEHVIDPENYVYVDAWTSGNPGIGGYRVVDHTGKVLLEKNYEDKHSNNWYELGAIASACWKFPGKIIWSDSVTAMAWANGRIGKDASKKYAEDASFHAMIKTIRATKAVIYKWNTELWGEIIADYSRKSGSKRKQT